MASNEVKEVSEQERRKQLASFLYDMAKLMLGSVAIGGMSPLFTGKSLESTNLWCIIVGLIGGCIIAYIANFMLKIKKIIDYGQMRYCRRLVPL